MRTGHLHRFGVPYTPWQKVFAWVLIVVSIFTAALCGFAAQNKAEHELDRRFYRLKP